MNAPFHHDSVRRQQEAFLASCKPGPVHPKRKEALGILQALKARFQDEVIWSPQFERECNRLCNGNRREGTALFQEVIWSGEVR